MADGASGDYVLGRPVNKSGNRKTVVCLLCAAVNVSSDFAESAFCLSHRMKLSKAVGVKDINPKGSRIDEARLTESTPN